MLEFRFNEDNKVNQATKYDDLRKELVLHSASSFNDKNLNVFNCLETLTNLIYLLNQGEKFSHSEKENLFFNVTKLLHSHDSELKRMVFIFISHLKSKENYFILTGPLLNEINGENYILKTTSLRTIGHIIDLSNIAVVERHLKTALFHKTLEISNAAILCTYYLTIKGSDFAKSWIRELTDKINSAINLPNLQTFHLMILLNEIKQNDKLFLMKMFQNLCTPNLKSQFARCQLIRYLISMIKRGEIEDQKVFNAFHTYLEQCLQKHQQESVILEAARGVIETPTFKNSLLPTAIDALKVLLMKERKVFKYSALKTLDRAATINPNMNALDFFIDLEKIIDDTTNNASIKALALSIFLKISKTLSSSRLEKMFKTFTDQYATFKEEFKKDVILISRSISRQDPTKLKLYFNFFANLIKLEANYATKDELVESIIWFIYNDKELKRNAIFCLADYIEDCEFDKIKTKILSILGKEGGNIASSNQLIRLIYNRIILEGPVVRCAAISALGEISNCDTETRINILNLIKRSLNDADHEVRERAYLYYKILTSTINEKKDDLTNAVNASKLKKYTYSSKGFDVDVLQNVLSMNKESLLLSNDISSDLNNILRDPDRIAKMLISQGQSEDKKNLREVDKKDSKEKKEKKDESSKLDISSVITKAYGNPKLITKFVKITDQYAEINASYRKLIMDGVIIIDIELTNTLEDIIQKNVSLEINEMGQNEGLDLSKSEIIEVDQLKFNEPKHLYFKLSRLEEINYPTCYFSVNLKFDVQEIDAKGNPHGNSYKDTYKIGKKIELKFSDFFKNDGSVRIDNFENFWKLTEESDYHLFEEKLQLPFNSIKAAGKNISELLGLDPLNEIDKVDINAKKYEFIFYSGSIYNTKVLIRLQMVVVPQNSQCIARVLIRTQDESLAELIVNTLLKG